MARRGNSTEAVSPEAVSTNEEAPVSTTTEVEAVEAETPSTEATEVATEADEKAPVDLTSFEAVVTEAVESADTSTGEVPEAGKANVTAAYRELDARGKRAAKERVAGLMRESLTGNNIAKARSYMTISDSLVAGATKSATPKATVNPVDSYVDRAAALRLAYAAMPVPEGIDSTASDKIQSAVTDNQEAVNSYVAWLTSTDENKGDAPEASSLVVNAAKLAVGKGTKVGSSGSTRAPFEGTRRNIANHIEEAFANVAPGTFLKISEIKGFKSSEYGDDSPSAGAISARLFPASGKVGTFSTFKPSTNEDGDKGAVRI